MINNKPYELSKTCQIGGDTIAGVSFTDIEIAGVPIDLNNYEISYQIRNDTNTVLFDFSIGNGVIIDSVNSFHTEPFVLNDKGVYNYDYRFTNTATLEVSTWFEGVIEITQNKR